MGKVLCWLSGRNTDTFLRQDVDQQWAGAIILGWGENCLVLLVTLDVLEIHVEEVRGIHWATLGFGVKLSRKDRARLMNHAFQT